MLFKRKIKRLSYDSDCKIPVIKASICNGEQVAGFKDIKTGAFVAVFGLVGALLSMAVKNKGSIEGLGIRQILLMIALSLVSGLTSAGVGNVAHFGGLATGFIIGLILYKRRCNEGKD